MCPFISWCNANEGFLSALFAFFSLIISFAAVGISIVAILQTKKQTLKSDIQQQQNVNLTLLPLRQNVLQLFSEEKYNDLIWNAQILFDSATFLEIEKTKKLYDERKVLHAQIEEYENKMSSDMPELYEEYMNLSARIEQAESYETDSELLYDLCQSYLTTVNDIPFCFEMTNERCIQIQKKYIELHQKTILLIKEEIKSKTT